MRLLIQIPCLNERETLPLVIRSLPTQLAGISEIKTLVIDDGSSDGTSETARQFGVDFVIRHEWNKGLAASFITGLEFAKTNDFDILVNTDGDNQYKGSEIPDLIAPIVANSADFVVGCREWKSTEFSRHKIMLQTIGSRVVSLLAGAKVNDVTSGFRAFNKKSIQTISIYDQFTYTLETILQSKSKRLRIETIPITVNKKERDSRLFSSNLEYLNKAIPTIIMNFAIYSPFSFFMKTALLFGLLFLLGAIRFMYFFALGDGNGHIQSLTLSIGFFVISFQIIGIGIVCELIRQFRDAKRK